MHHDPLPFRQLCRTRHRPARRVHHRPGRAAGLTTKQLRRRRRRGLARTSRVAHVLRGTFVEPSVARRTGRPGARLWGGRRRCPGPTAAAMHGLDGFDAAPALPHHDPAWPTRRTPAARASTPRRSLPPEDAPCVTAFRCSRSSRTIIDVAKFVRAEHAHGGARWCHARPARHRGSAPRAHRVRSGAAAATASRS